MIRKILFSLIVALLVLTSCENPTRTEYVYLSSNDTGKPRPEPIIRFKGDIISTKAGNKDRFEPNDSFSNAKNIAVEKLEVLNFYDDASDWLSFNAEKGTKYTIETWVYDEVDTELYLYNSSQTELKYNDDKGDGTYGSAIKWTAPESGTYYIASNSYKNKTRGASIYEIAVMAKKVKDAYEDDDSSKTAKLIGIDTVQHHDFSDDSEDWVVIDAKRGQIYTFESVVMNSTDTLFTLYDQSLIKLDTNDDGGIGLASKIEYISKADGKLYLKMNSYNGKTGANEKYSVIVTKIVDPNALVLPQPSKKWTVLVYLCADNDLNDYGAKDIKEMYGVGSNDDFNIVVLWDNDKARAKKEKHGYYYIKKGEASLIKDLGEIDMGEEKTATDFISWAVENFPADHYMFDYWNHGSAVDRSGRSVPPRGIAYDDTGGKTWLNENEQKRIIQHFYNLINRKIDIISYDACLMATTEIAYMYKGYADYLVASEQTEPGDGWDYSFLNAIKDKPTIVAKDLAIRILDSYMAWYNRNSDVTFSVSDLSYVDELATALDKFCIAAINSGKDDKLAYKIFKDLRGGAADFSKYTRDLYGYMAKVNSSIEVPLEVPLEIRNLAQKVMDVIKNNFIVKEAHGSGWNNKAYGISITMKADTPVYSQLDICRDTKWDEFLTFCKF